MTDPLFSPTPVPSNMLLDLNLNIKLYPETRVYDDKYNVKHRQPDTSYEPGLFEPLKQIRVSHATLKVTEFIEFGVI